MTAAATLDAPPTFVWDGDYDNVEQVRPYFPVFAAIRADLEEADEYPYNDRFKGIIPGLDVSANEDTAIYLLQQMHGRDEVAAKVEEFLASGGRVIPNGEDATEILRGTVVHAGFYMGGTGWKVYESARLVRSGGTMAVLPKGKRTNGYFLSGSGFVLFRPATARARDAR